MDYRTDVIYCEQDVQPAGYTTWLYFTSPDGVGRIFFDSLAKAKEETGLQSVVHLI